MLPITHPRPLPCARHLYEFGVYDGQFMSVIIWPAYQRNGLREMWHHLLVRVEITIKYAFKSLCCQCVWPIVFPESCFERNHLGPESGCLCCLKPGSFPRFWEKTVPRPISQQNRRSILRPLPAPSSLLIWSLSLTLILLKNYSLILRDRLENVHLKSSCPNWLSATTFGTKPKRFWKYML